jgi:hypothetical protein
MGDAYPYQVKIADALHERHQLRFARRAYGQCDPGRSQEDPADHHQRYPGRETSQYADYIFPDLSATWNGGSSTARTPRFRGR